MFALTESEHTAIVEAVHNVLGCSKLERVLVNLKDLCDHLGCRKREPAMSLLVSEIQDLLTSYNFCELFGRWLFAELDGNDWVFVQISKPGEKVWVEDLLNNGNCAAYSFHENWPARRKGRRILKLANVYGKQVTDNLPESE